MGQVFETLTRPFSWGAKARMGSLGAGDIFAAIHEGVKNQHGGSQDYSFSRLAAGPLSPPAAEPWSVDRIAGAANWWPRLAQFANRCGRTPGPCFFSRRTQSDAEYLFGPKSTSAIASARPSGARSRFLGWGSTLLEAITCRPTLSPLCLGDCLGLDHDLGQPIPSTLMFRSAWRKARTPRNIDQWQGVDPKGLEEFIELAEQSTQWAPPHVAVERKGRDIFDMIGEGGKDTRGIGFDLPTRTACSGG